MTDAHGEAEETRVWLDFALEHGHLGASEHEALSATYRVLCGGLITMINAPATWCLPPVARRPRPPGPPAP